jgi:hypothetical protein
MVGGLQACPPPTCVWNATSEDMGRRFVSRQSLIVLYIHRGQTHVRLGVRECRGSTTFEMCVYVYVCVVLGVEG